jgi:2-keto-3-deoxy-L-rhamnonate aldolase RhmA
MISTTGGMVMKARVTIGLLSAAAVVGVSMTAQQPTHLNPMVDLLIAKKAIFGVAVPSVGRGGGGRPGGAPGAAGTAGGGSAAGAAATPAATPTTPPPPPKTPAELAADAIAHPEADFFFTASMERNADTGAAALIPLQEALVAAGPLTPSAPKRLRMPIHSKAGNISSAEMPADPARYGANIARQLNVGVSTLAFVEVDNAEELRQGIAAMRFKSKGGIRPNDVGDAPKYWGISEAEYRKRADVWPLNPEGDLLVLAIVETKEGLENVREIAQVPGLSILTPGAGTLGGVFSSMVDGKRVRDDVAWEAAIQKVLAACKEFKKQCGYPVNENDVETRYQQGFNFGILQAFNDAAFRAVAKGRAISGR